MRDTSRWRWYASRLRAMGAGELAFRGCRALESVAEDTVWRFVPGAWDRSWVPALQDIAGPQPSEPRGPLSPERVRSAAAAAPEEASRIVAAATGARAGRVRFFGYAAFDLEAGQQLRDPVTGRDWPLRHGKRLDYRRAGYGDPKWIWEANRLQQLPLLCTAAGLTGDEGFAAEAALRAVAWARDARPPYGMAWSNGFEAGLRAVSLALVLDALRGSAALDDAGRSVLLRALWQHARWIERDPSRGSSANNHLVGEATGLLAIALLAPELRDAEGWANRASQILAREAGAQVLPDGTGAEQAFAYHLFVCDLLLLTASLYESTRGTRAPEPVLAALRRAGNAIAVQVAPGEPDPAYGDSDDGRAFVLDAEEIRSSQGIAAAIACAVGHPGCAALAKAPDVPALLLFGEDGVARFRNAGGASATGSAVLPDGGIVVLRREGVRALFDAGPLGYLGIVAHGHADALSVAVSNREQELVSDPGTRTYFGDDELRRTFRGTPAHPTVTVGGGDQAEYGGPFLWLRHPRVRLVHADPDGGVAIGELLVRTGARTYRHRRTVAMQPSGEILVYDRIDGEDALERTISWPLHPDVTAVRRDDRVVDCLVNERSQLLIAIAAGPDEEAAKLRVSVDRGEWSRRLEQGRPTAVVRATAPAADRTDLVTLLVPLRGRAADDPQLSLYRDDARTVVQFGGRSLTFDLDAAPVDLLISA